MNFFDRQSDFFKEIFFKTTILRRPISGIVSGYHELPYIFVAPDDDNDTQSIEINGKINVSPKFVISPSMLSETFGDVFDPETFDKDLQGRFFSFAYGNRKNVKIHNEYFHVKNIEEKPEEYSKRVLDQLLMQENITTGLILGPRFKYYPVSLDRFINEIVDREFNV
ncbi:MAG TPA: hypothetical protein VF335_09715 [Chitinivibrionales bacterium]|jgi:hypothetical protein